MPLCCRSAAVPCFSSTAASAVTPLLLHHYDLNTSAQTGISDNCHFVACQSHRQSCICNIHLYTLSQNPSSQYLRRPTANHPRRDLSTNQHSIMCRPTLQNNRWLMQVQGIVTWACVVAFWDLLADSIGSKSSATTSSVSACHHSNQPLRSRDTSGGGGVGAMLGVGQSYRIISDGKAAKSSGAISIKRQQRSACAAGTAISLLTGSTLARIHYSTTPLFE